MDFLTDPQFWFLLTLFSGAGIALVTGVGR